MFRKCSRKIQRISLGIGVLMLATNCGYEMKKKGEKDIEHHYSTRSIEVNSQEDSDVDSPTECKLTRHGFYNYGSYNLEEKFTYYCYENKKAVWVANCELDSCKKVPVFVHYMINKVLGDGYSVNVEAFDNQYFQGVPIGNVEVTNFKASKGEWKETELLLGTGIYYLRAYLSTEQDPRIPYSLGGMELMAETPVGIYGVLSSAEKLVVEKSGKFADPTHIYLDKLFRKPGSEPDTNAHVRVIVTIPESYDIEIGRNVVIQLHETEDFEADPLAEMRIPTEMFKVEGRIGQAEVLSESLDVGQYLVLAYLDADGNNFYDEGEIFAVHNEHNEPAYIDIKENTTRSIRLNLD